MPRKRSKRQFTFRLYQTVRFNRPFDKNDDMVSLGPYQLKIKRLDGTDYHMTLKFEDLAGTIHKKNKCLVEYLQFTPDCSECDDPKDLTPDMLENIQEIIEWNIFCKNGSEDDTREPLQPLEVIDPVFVIIPKHGDIYRVPITVKVNICERRLEPHG